VAAPGIALPVTRIGRGGHPWLSICETQSRKAMTCAISVSSSFGFGHQPTMHLVGVEQRRILEERGEVGLAPELGDLRQIRREVRALTEQRVAVDAVLAVPDMLALGHVFGDEVRVGQLGELAVAVHGHRDEDEGKEGGTADEEQPCLTLRHIRLR
jgi:hypothetical protein